MNLRETISWLKAKIQSDLFPHLEENFKDPLTEKQKKLITILELLEIEKHVKAPEYQWMGRKLKGSLCDCESLCCKSSIWFWDNVCADRGT